MDAIFHRVSIRKYEDKAVEPEKIEKILRAAMAAPSACNQQPWEFYVVTDKEKIEELSHASQYTGFSKGAPVIFVPCYRDPSALISAKYAEIDLSACVENMLLEADALGLGTCWMGIAPIEDRMEVVRKMLNIPENLFAFALVSCGYAKDQRPQQDRYEESRIHWV